MSSSSSSTGGSGGKASSGLFQKISRIFNNHQNYGTVVILHRYMMEAVRIIMRILGPALVLFASSLLLFVLYIFFLILLPSLGLNSVLLYGLHLCIGMFFIVNVFFNYLSCAMISAGTTVECDEPGRYFGRSVAMVEGRAVTMENYRMDVAPFVMYRYCNKCRAIKPPRAHHDSISGKCILVMDHYCPWMGSAVGYGNYRYFVLFLFYMFVGALYVIFITVRELFLIPQFLAAEGRMHRDISSAGDGGIATDPLRVHKILKPGSTDEQMVLFVFILGVAASTSVGILLFWHIYLSLSNQTTIEFYFNMAERADAKKGGYVYKNPYDQGWRKNLKRVFGDVEWYQALSLSRRPPPPPQYPFLPEEKYPASVSSSHSRLEEGVTTRKPV